MKTNTIFSKNKALFTFFGFLSVLLSSCSSYQNSSYYDNDGIYGTADAPRTGKETPNNSNNQYKDYFSSLQNDNQPTAIFTDVDTYNNYYEENDTLQNVNPSYSSWGSNPREVSVTVYPSNWGLSFGYGWGYPYSGWGYSNYYGYGYPNYWGYSNYYGYGYPYYGYNYGWNYPNYGYGYSTRNYSYNSSRRGSYYNNTGNRYSQNQVNSGRVSNYNTYSRNSSDRNVPTFSRRNYSQNQTNNSQTRTRTNTTRNQNDTPTRSYTPSSNNSRNDSYSPSRSSGGGGSSSGGSGRSSGGGGRRGGGGN